MGISEEVYTAEQLVEYLTESNVKLRVECGRLLFDAPKNVITNAIRQQLIDNKLEIIDLVSQDTSDVDNLLDDMQQAYWVGQSEALDLNIISNYYMEADFESLNIDRLSWAWRQLVERHGILRCIILPTGSPQPVHDIGDCIVETVDLRGVPESEVEQQLDNYRLAMLADPIPTDTWPQFVISATRFDDKVRLHFRFNLWIIDGWSLKVIMAELYSLCNGEVDTLPPLSLTSDAYVAQKKASLAGSKLDKARQYWRQRLGDLPAGPELPIATLPSQVDKPTFIHLSRRIDSQTVAKLKARASGSGLTLSLLFCAAYAEVLRRWSKNKDFCITMLYSSRHSVHPEAVDVVGNFGTTILLEARWKAGEGFVDRAKRLQSQFWNDVEHSQMSGIEVSRELHRHRGDTSGLTVPVTFTSVTSGSEARDEQSDKSLTRYKLSYSKLEVAQVFLDFQVMEDAEDGLLFNWDYVKEIFPAETVEAMFGAYIGLLHELSDDDQLWQSSSLDILPEDDARRIARMNVTAAPVSDEHLHTLFLNSVFDQPDELAVIDADNALTYGQLADVSWMLAEKLHACGVEPNTLVAVSMEKGWEQVAAVLGILLAGSAYVPIDPHFPADRLQILLEESEASIVLTQTRLMSVIDSKIAEDTQAHTAVNTVIDVSTLLARCNSQERARLKDHVPRQKLSDLAYVIFTSGSTGRPKGVMIDHRGAVNTVLDINERFSVTSSDRVLAVSSLSFDLSVYDIFGLLAAGGCLVFPDPGLAKEPGHWLHCVQTHNISLWNSVPALMQLLVEYAQSEPGAMANAVATSDASSDALASLRLVMMSGDWIPLPLPELIRTQVPSAEIISLGGATEASIWSILYPIDRVDPEWKSIPYGYPMKNQQFYVLDDDFRPCPTWVRGQLYIGGIGVAKGYWSNEEKTLASFMQNPLTGERIYKTGDLGRLLPNGTLEFMGREDFQVKIQGYRIECAEIECALSALSGVKAALVKAVGDQQAEKQLVAYVVIEEQADSQGLAARGLQASLAKTLPQYMVPTQIIPLPALPLTSNGKIDHKSLPKPEMRAAETSQSRILPRNALEKSIASVWSPLLAVADIDVTESFFDLGGTSFIGMRLVANLQKHFSVSMTLTDLLENPTVEKLAIHLEFQIENQQDAKASTPQCLVNIQTDGERAPLFCIHPVGGNVLCYVELAKLLGNHQPVYGLQSLSTFDSDNAHTSIESMAAHYLSLIKQKQPEGPYRLLGWSLGGVVAYEMARQLQLEGETLECVAMIDSYLPEPEIQGASETAADSHLQYLKAFARDISGISTTSALAMDEAKMRGMQPAAQLSYFIALAKGCGVFSDDLPESQISRIFEAFRLNLVALQQYQAMPFDGHLCLFQAAERLREGDQVAAWSALASSVKVNEIAGDHFSIVQPKSFTFISRELGLLS